MMKKLKTIQAALAAAFLLPFAVNGLDEDTLTRDYPFEKPKETWNVKHAKVEHIEAFEGLADTFSYLSGKQAEKLIQKNIKVKPKTWYVVNYIYRTEKMLWFNGNVKASVDGKPLGRGTAYDAKNWQRGKFFFYTDKYDSVDLSIDFHAWNVPWQIGRITIRPMSKSDYENWGMMRDSGFELSTSGHSPDFVRKSIKVVSEDPFSGKKCARFDFPEKTKGYAAFSTGHFFLNPGDTLSGSIKIRAQRPVKMYICPLNWSGNTRIPKRCVQDIGTEWREVKFDFRPETFKDGRMSSGACYLYFYFQQEDAPNTIWFDDLEYSIKRADDKSARITKPLAVNPSFEIGLDGWEIQVDEAAAGYKNTRGRMSIDTDAAVGKYSLKVMKPRNPPDLKANCRTLIRPLPFHQQLNRDFTISFWAKSDRPTNLALCLTYTGIGSFSLTPEWKRFTASYKARRALHPGETADELRIFSPNDGATVWLDGFQIEPGKTATGFKPDADYEAGTVIPDRVYKLVRNGESFPLRIYAVSYINDPKAKKIRLTVSDFFGKQVHQEVHPLSFKGRDTRTLDLILKTGKPGQFKARAEILDAEGKTLVSGDSVFAVLNPPMEIPTEKSSIGINENIVNSRSGAPAYLWQCNNNLDDYLAALRLAGIRHMRIWDVGDWRSQEPRPGDFNFVWDDFLKRVKAQKIGTHVCFMPSSRQLPDWSQSTTGYLHPERHRGKFIPKLEDTIRFTEAYSKHYKGLIDSIGWMNETGDLAPKDYVDFAKALRPVFKKNMPGIKFSGASYPNHCLPYPSGKDDSWIGEVIRLGFAKYSDVMLIHRYDSGQAHTIPYLHETPFENLPVGKWGPIPDMLEQQIRKYHKEQSKHEIWDDESGFMFRPSSSWGLRNAYERDANAWYTDRVAAARLIRFWIMKAGAGITRQYNFNSVGSFFGGPGDLMYFNSDLSPAPSLPATSQLARTLDGSRFHSKFKLGRDTLVYIFKMFNGKTAAVYWNWNLENRQDGTLTIPAEAQVLAAYNIMGEEIPAQKRKFPLQDCPVYLISDQSPETFAAALKRANAVAIPLTPFVNLGNADGKAAVIATVQNNSTLKLSPVKIVLRSGGTTAANGEKQIELAMKQVKTVFPLAELKPGKTTFHLRAEVDGRFFSTERTENIAVITRGATRILNLKNGASEAELSGFWTSDALDFKLKVKDPTPFPASADKAVFAGDCAEFYLDFAPERVDMSLPRYTKSAVRITFAPGTPVRIEYHVNGMANEVVPMKEFDFKAVTAKSRKTADGYEMDIRIPLKIKLSAGMVLGFNLHVIDTAPSGNPKRPVRKTELSMQEKTCWNDIRNFGKLLLKQD